MAPSRVVPYVSEYFYERGMRDSATVFATEAVPLGISSFIAKVAVFDNEFSKDGALYRVATGWLHVKERGNKGPMVIIFDPGMKSLLIFEANAQMFLVDQQNGLLQFELVTEKGIKTLGLQFGPTDSTKFISALQNRL